MTAFEGVLPVVPTIFEADGEVDHGAIESVVRSQAARGVDGVICFGIAGEFYKLSDAERRAIVDTVTAVCADADLACHVSVTDHATPRAVAFAEYAAAAGADGLMVLPPFFLGPSEAALLSHLRTVGRATDLPVMVQYAPEQTGTPIQPSTFVDLAETVETIGHVKVESQPPGPYISELLDAAGGEVDVLVGYAGIQMVEAWDRGAVGVIPGAALSDVYLAARAAFLDDDRETLLDLHARLLPLLEVMIQDIELFIHYEKALLARRGVVEAGAAREPAAHPDAHYDAQFEAALERVLAVVD
jgi:4-hydroxy-tetrahydrodipicolinate synthase